MAKPETEHKTYNDYDYDKGLKEIVCTGVSLFLVSVSGHNNKNL